ncbi:CUE domain-containing protein [Aspergillus clavatus NRRL 1]|uniref:CUE domain protein, putative n=1 Tax=Aspergillus clavatus (strain ATCC 1007 / CBS 513.65 / DSM 816 / NCTC 3887 / NRRL 1 / QM 1276 / 107) TaxID=344612 RepID=A1CQI4_ASPCL|nr:CUE domain protein, putative [Aspergillus clavatus NRRL 1]EAW07905.1 CUE domain protein, putative [Aspergillus clavatus NRRL 1]
MSDEDKMTPGKSLAGPLSPKPESPTTARPLDFDDEPQETGVTSAPAQQTEAAPPKPPRPLSPQQQAQNTLKEAFPTIEASVIKAVLVASNWEVERAFHALLGMTDPTAQQEEVAPPRPPRPSATQKQLEQDELYARQLAEHYNRRAPQPRWDESRHDGAARRSNESEEREYSFFDDDLPVIRENLRKGFLETQSKVNSWVQNLKKRIDGEDLEEESSSGRGYGETQGYNRPRRSGDMGRRSGDRERYDADPQLLSDDFSALELRDSEGWHAPLNDSRYNTWLTPVPAVPPPQPPRRPLANANLYKPASPSPDRRRVSFQEGPPAEIGNLYDASEPARRTSAMGSKSNKWQPLSTVEPSPVADHDPFSLGDSEDERETKAKDQNTADENDRTKQATAEAMAGELDSAKNGDKTQTGGKS